MDVKPPYLYVACGDVHIHVYDLRKITPGTPYQVEPYRNLESPLSHQIKSISGFPDNTGFAIGTLGGRVAMMHLDKKSTAQNFAFACHRDDEFVYPINDIDFHPIYDCFATSGADGTYCFWDRNRRQLMKSFAKNPQPLSFGRFNSEGEWAQ
jgi:mRNA export factor